MLLFLSINRIGRELILRALDHRLAIIFVLFGLFASPLSSQPAENYDYHQSTQMMVYRGTQALMICNGLFVSNRTLEQIYAQELKLNHMPVLPPSMVEIDREKRTVAVGVGGNSSIPVMRAVYREGLGTVLLAPDQDFDDIDELPELKMPPLSSDPGKISWPDGDLHTDKILPKGVSKKALEAAGEWAFNRIEHGGHDSQITLSLLVVYKGQILYERYAPGVDFTTKTRTWSTAKSIASTLIGIAVGQGKLSLDESLPYKNWGPKITGDDTTDPRRAITLRNVLHMSSGLYPVDNRFCHVVGSCLSYWCGASSVRGALDRGLIRAPGKHWDYENYDTILAIYALKTALGDAQTYLEFPRKALFDKIGMRNTMPGVDRFGDYVMSSQVYTNARDLARLGLLHLNKGKWNDEQILPKEWVEFVRTPAPSTEKTGRFYGGQWWLAPDDRTDIPAGAYSTAGHRGQHTVVVPSQDLVIVRRGLDWQPGKYRFSWHDLTREVMKALPKRPWGEKPGDSMRSETGSE